MKLEQFSPNMMRPPSPEQEVQMYYVIGRVEILNLKENEAPPDEKPKTSQKIPKWVTKTLESVHLDEVRKKRNISSTRQEYGGVVDNSSLVHVEYMDVSYDSELLFYNLKITSFEEVVAHYEWKESMQNEYYALIKNGIRRLVSPPFGTKLIFVSGYTSKSTYHMVDSTRIR